MAFCNAVKDDRPALGRTDSGTEPACCTCVSVICVSLAGKGGDYTDHINISLNFKVLAATSPSGHWGDLLLAQNHTCEKVPLSEADE